MQEFRPGGATRPTNLTTTELGVADDHRRRRPGNPLPAADRRRHRRPDAADEVIEDDATGNVETSGVFDPANDGIDF